MSLTSKLLVDIHTHVYLPRYTALLRSRTSVPFIRSTTTPEGATDDRLLILDHEPSGGRPVGSQYWDREEKLKFMDKHGIDVSIVRYAYESPIPHSRSSWSRDFTSTANPWLDFLPASKAQTLASELNNDLEEYCSTGPSLSSHEIKRLYGFGLLPLVPEITTSALVDVVHQIGNLPHLRGLIMGTRGIGKGLDDESLDPVWAAIEKAGLVVFLHPHYGVDASAWGDKYNGHVLPLALGFPFETTTAATRLILSGVFDKFPSLRLLLAHSGGALPALSSRLASCIDHDPVVASRLKHDARYYLGKLYLDAVAYGPEELGFASDILSRAPKYETTSSVVKNGADRSTGSKRMLFGTDHPFFPPLSMTEKWKSVVENLEAIEAVQGWSQEDKDGVRGGNAVSLFALDK
ncbi:2-amino-3-carboxymuconate-6-semialdehyde decarboxylase [Psilocybe cubensis]|uniref:2-amino-3-carboxymuconate-6-semialdehyde decarboxylase n=2 Tax=Psilocybe cubensis TaxID=181762 RepID=A0ACB8H4I6_PSICU|nr:2-amino-3-carboxymuconate-6-semialdehyde decarboxylase [Psilocybe cubensis]KAH9482761.1 2-amino-3-carboxymuconate-6-semialdehyde decarboxylase [Psilocybe cubensis]